MGAVIRLIHVTTDATGSRIYVNAGLPSWLPDRGPDRWVEMTCGGFRTVVAVYRPSE